MTVWISLSSLYLSSWDVAMQDVLHRYGALESPQHHIQVERVSHYPSWSEQDLSLGLKPWTRSFAQHQLQCWYVFYIGHYLLMQWILRASMTCTFGTLCCLHSCVQQNVWLKTSHTRNVSSSVFYWFTHYIFTQFDTLKSRNTFQAIIKIKVLKYFTWGAVNM